MATYKIDATIYLKWHNIQTKEDALNEIQQALDSYYYDNKSDPVDFVVMHHSVKRITSAEMEKECYGF